MFRVLLLTLHEIIDDTRIDEKALIFFLCQFLSLKEKIWRFFSAINWYYFFLILWFIKICFYVVEQFRSSIKIWM